MTRQLRVRIQEHISHIKNNISEAPLVQHVISNQHASNGFKVVVLEIVQPIAHTDTHKLLLQWEAFWIFKLETLAPHGVNNNWISVCFCNPLQYLLTTAVVPFKYNVTNATSRYL